MSQNESTDSNEIEFNNGIKMIVNAYETQTTFLSNEESFEDSSSSKLLYLSTRSLYSRRRLS